MQILLNINNQKTCIESKALTKSNNNIKVLDKDICYCVEFPTSDEAAKTLRSLNRIKMNDLSKYAVTTN